MKNGVKSPAFLATAAVIVAGTVALMTESDSVRGAIGGTLVFVPFSLGPLFLSLLVAVFSPQRSSQIVLSLGSILYAVWFGFVFLDVFYWHLDPQSAVALLFTGIYSLPVLIPLWLVSLVLMRKRTQK